MTRFMMLAAAIGALALTEPAAAQTSQELFQRALVQERGAGDLHEAIRLYWQVANGSDRVLAARALVRIGEGYERLGRREARQAYERVLNEFSDQRSEVEVARARLALLAAAAADAAPAVPPARLTSRLVWEGTEPTIDIEGQPTPDGRFLTFVDWTTGNLAVRDVAAGTHRALTSTGYPQYALQSSVSREGRRVAYQWQFEERQPQLRVIDIDGRDERIVIDNAAREIAYMGPQEWTPDGRSVLVVLYMKDGTGRLGLADVENASLTIVRSFDWRVPFRASLSPDGRYIVYDRRPDESAAQRDIYLVSTDGSREVALVTHPANDQHPIWTPDGRNIFFSSDRGGSIDLWTVPVREGEPSGEPTLVKRDMAHNFFWPMGFTRDGTLFYAKDTGGGDVYIAPLDPSTGMVSGEPRRAVDTHVGYNTSPHVTPAGDRIVFATRTGAVTSGHSARLAVQTLGTAAKPELVPNIGLNRVRGRPRWAPDGRRVVLVGNSNRSGGVFIVDVDGRTVEPVSTSPLTERTYDEARFIRGGEAVMYGGMEPADDPAAEFTLRIRDLRTDADTEVHRAPAGRRGWDRTWDVTPDGRFVAIAEHEGERRRILVLDLEKGTTRELHALPHARAASRHVGVAWTADARHVLFGVAPDEWELTHGQGVAVWRAPVDGGAPGPIGLEVPSLRHLSVLADGSAVAFAAGHQVYHEVWVLENTLAQLRAAR